MCYPSSLCGNRKREVEQGCWPSSSRFQPSSACGNRKRDDKDGQHHSLSWGTKNELTRRATAAPRRVETKNERQGGRRPSSSYLVVWKMKSRTRRGTTPPRCCGKRNEGRGGRSPPRRTSSCGKRKQRRTVTSGKRNERRGGHSPSSSHLVVWKMRTRRGAPPHRCGNRNESRGGAPPPRGSGKLGNETINKMRRGTPSSSF